MGRLKTPEAAVFLSLSQTRHCVVGAKHKDSALPQAFQAQPSNKYSKRFLNVPLKVYIGPNLIPMMEMAINYLRAWIITLTEL